MHVNVYDECMKDNIGNKHYEKHLKITMKNDFINNLHNLHITLKNNKIHKFL